MKTILKEQIKKVIRWEINSILSRRSAPRSYDSDELFEKLQRAYPPRTGYGFGMYGNWKRGVERGLSMLNRFDLLRSAGLDVLEAGCGDGMAGHALRGYGHDVTLVDIDDWRDERVRDLEFVKCDMCKGIPLAPDHFDLVYSFNTFEHIDAPPEALENLIRVCKRGGLIYLEFGPLYASSWGLHAYSTIHMPYSQFLFSEAFLKDKIKELGIYDLGKERSELQPLNMWRPGKFMDLFNRSGCEMIWVSELSDLSNLAYVRRFYKAFTGRGLRFEDITTQALYVALRKK